MHETCHPKLRQNQEQWDGKKGIEVMVETTMVILKG